MDINAMAKNPALTKTYTPTPHTYTSITDATNLHHPMANDDATHRTQQDDQEDKNGAALIQATIKGDLALVQSLLAAGAPAYYQETIGGTSPLMHAAKGLHLEIVQALLSAGAPWNALDREQKCAGEYAMNVDVEAVSAAAAATAETAAVEDVEELAMKRQAVINALVDHAVIAEMLLGTLEDRQNTEESDTYLQGKVRYEKDRLVDEAEEGVMMEWEAPLMEAHAGLLCGEDQDRDVMNLGFGMGIIDSAIQRNGCRSHTIVEAHPDVLAKMKADGWQDKANVHIEAGRWQEALPRLIAQGKKFDAIFFDTYAEHYRDMQAFHEWLPKLLRVGGMYSFFNGLAPDNIFFHAVTCQMVKLELEALGFAVDFATVEVKGGAAEEGTWEGLRRRYWHGRTEYYLPVAIFQGEEGGGEGQQDEGDEMEVEVGQEAPLAESSTSNDDATADDTLVGEAELENGEKVEVLLHASLDPEAGGLTWRPLTGPDGVRGRTDPVSLLQLRCWFPQMLHDKHRHVLLRKAIVEGVKSIQQEEEKKKTHLRVVDIGTGTGLLSLEAAAAAGAGTEVVACEGFPALAAVAAGVVRDAGMEDKVKVLSKRSTSLEKEEDLGGSNVDLVISELLDSTLLGEGYLPSLRDLFARGLLSPTETHVLPARARVWAQLVECPELMHHCSFPGAGASCVGGGRPVPLYLAPPSSSSSSKRKKNEDDAAASDWAGGPIPSVALSAPFPLLEIDFAAFAAAATPANSVGGNPMAVGSTVTVSVERTGTLHGVLMWWELTPSFLDGGSSGKEESYSTIPRDPATDPLWQDHWKPCIWPLLPSSSSSSSSPSDKKVVEAGQTVAVQGAHDDHVVWLHVGDAGGSDGNGEAVLREGPSPCLCGMHGCLPVGRLLELNDANRRAAYQQALQQVILAGAGEEKKTVLDICDGGYVASLLASAAATDVKIVSLEEHPWHAVVLRNNQDAVSVWRGAGAGESWDAEAWGEQVQMLCGDGYYHKVGLNRPVWSWLNFWILRTALSPILARDVVVLPFQARVMAAVVECPSLFRTCRGNALKDEEVGGWNHEAYRRAVHEAEAGAECDEDKDLPVSLADHPHRFLTPPALVMRLDLHKEIDWRAPRQDDGAYRRTVIHVPVEKAGQAHALALWVETDLTYEEAAFGGGGGGGNNSGSIARHARQTLRWLEGKQVGADGWRLEIKAAMDLVDTPSVWTECRLWEGKMGEGEGGEEEDERN